MVTKKQHKLLAVLLTIVMLASQLFLAPVPVSAEETPLQPGEVRTYKTATPVEGMVNTWDIKVRIEGKDDVKTLTTDIVLVIDRSGSMGGNSGRMDAAKKAAKAFIDYMIQKDQSLRIGIVSFANSSSKDQDFSRNTTSLKQAITNMSATGGTHTQAGLYEAKALMETSTADRRFIVFLSDGEPTYSYEPVNWNVVEEQQPGYYFTGGGSSGTSPGNFMYENKKAIYDGNYTTTRVGSGNLIRSSTTTHNGDRYWPQEVGGTIYYPLDRAWVSTGSGFSGYYEYTAKNMNYIDNGLAAIKAADDTKAILGSGGLLFTIALSAGTEGTSILQSIATTSSLAYATSDNASLEAIYNEIGIAISTQHAINDAVITDEMGDGFSLIAGSLDVTEGTTSVAPAVGGDNETITWTINPYVSNMVSGSTDVRFAEMTYRVEINPDILNAAPSTVDPEDSEHNLFFTNKSTQMSYKDFSGNSEVIPFISPEVDPVLLKIRKHLTDIQGNVVTSDPRTFDVQIFKSEPNGFDYTQTLAVGAGYVWLTTLRHEGTYTITETGVSEGSLNEFDKSYVINGSATSSFLVNHIGEVPRGDVIIDVTNRENVARVSFGGTKTLIGRTGTSIKDEFQFTLTAEGNAKMPASNSEELTFYGNGSQNFNFGEVKYTLADLGGATTKEFSYKIEEVIPSPVVPGIEYDATPVRTVKVTLSKDGSGKISASVEPASVSFTNKYGATGSWIPKVSKDLTGRALKAGDFSFQLKKGTEVLQTKSNALNGDVVFDAIGYTEADIGKTYTYTIHEVVPTVQENGMTYDPMVVAVSVTIADAGGGQLTVTPAYPKDTEFNNVYGAVGRWIPKVSKDLAGRALKAGDFSFQLKKGTEVLQTKSNALNGDVVFDAIGYTEADIGKTYTYTIHEVVPTVQENGMTYDPMVVAVSVTIADAGGGQLTVTPAYPKDTEFNNVYGAVGSWIPKVSKDLTGRALKAGDFNFQLKKGTEVLQTKSNALNGDVVFDAIGYTESDIGKTYTYTIHEVVPTVQENGMTYDPMVVTVSVTIADAGGGQLTVTPAYPKDTEFNNVYGATGSWIPKVSKDLTGRALKAGDFSFQLKKGTEVLQTKSNALNGDVVFDAIGYTEADIGKTYAYTIHEVVPTVQENGMTYDPMVVTVSVTIADAGGGQLTVTPAYPKDTEFNNVYGAVGRWIPKVSKDLTGRALKAGDFSFQLKKGTEVLQTKSNALNGDVVFDAIGYTEADIGKTYTYTIHEVVPTVQENGMTYDPMVVTISVTIADAGGGQLTVTPAYPKDTEFNNSYRAKATEVDLEGAKILEGRDLKDHEFKFSLYLYYEPGVLPTWIETVENVGGRFAFKTLVYDAPGTYYYMVKELDEVPGGVTMDTTIYMVVVQIIDDLEGQLQAYVGYAFFDPETEKWLELEIDEIVFNNRYKATNGQGTISGTKALSGRPLREGEFTFELYQADAEGQVATGATPLATTTNVGSAWSFTLDFTAKELGDHYYVVREKRGNSPGVSYDNSSFFYHLYVYDDLKGQIKVQVTAPEDREFNNRYTSIDGSGIISGTKVLEGRALANSEFTFELYLADAEGKVPLGASPMMTTTNTGNIWSFTLTYGRGDEGTHYYVVREKAGILAGIVYDDAEFFYRVAVSDGGKGSYEVAVTHPSQTEFKNRYEASGSYQPIVKKFTTGGLLLADAFEFELVDPEGHVIQKVKNLLNGSIPFEALTFGLEDAGKTFAYTIREVQGDEEGVIYDDRILSLTLTVMDEGGGYLKVTRATGEGPLSFTNTFELVAGDEDEEPDDVPVTGEGQSLYTGLGLLMVSLAALAVILILIAHRKRQINP